uniref:Uncharacterized protein n=1 Tax=Oryza rufipogon TaxID=4529 RepID=A0A0E0QZV7_ORYRU
MSRRLYMSGAVWKGFYRSNVIGKVFCGAVWKGFYQSNSGNCIPMSCKSKEVNNTTCLQDYKLIDLSHYELKLTEPTKGEMPLAEVLRFNTKVDCLILNR